MLRAGIADMTMFSEVDEITKTQGDNYIIVKIDYITIYIINLHTNDVIILTDLDNKFDIKNMTEEDISLLAKNKQHKRFNGPTRNLDNFYIQNLSIFCLSTRVYYEITFDDLKTYFDIYLTGGTINLSFESSNQYLYEHLLFKHDLTPSSMQDAQNRMDINMMQNIFNEVKNIIIPYNVIPVDLLTFINNRNIIEKTIVN